MTDAPPRLEIRNLTKRFGSFTANDGISLTVRAGELHCLLGENGAGKSTLSSCLFGLLQPEEGVVLVDGRALSLWSPADAIAAGIGMVHQHFVLVPAFTGLGAPYWRPDCRGAIFGLTRNSGPAELARAALESVGFQTRDLLEAMRADWTAAAEGVLRVDGGMSASDWAMQFLSDIIGAEVDRPQVLETTALGAAWLAGMQAGLCPGPEEFARSWALDRRFLPAMPAAERAEAYGRWQRAVQATMQA